MPVDFAKCHAVFITNHKRALSMWSQRAAIIDPVVWDYHVVLLGDGVIVDVDCTAGVILPVAHWVEASLRSFVPADAQPWFRVVDGPSFLATFSSDRSHMRDDNGVMSKPEPPWPALYQPALGMNLMRFVDLDDDIAGFVCDVAGLLSFAQTGVRP